MDLRGEYEDFTWDYMGIYTVSTYFYEGWIFFVQEITYSRI